LTVQWGTVPAWVAAAISVIFGIQSWRSSRKSKTERDQATMQAQKAERAVSAVENLANEAQRSAEAAERSATAHEAQASIASEQVAAEELKPWEFEPVRNSDKNILRNKTATPKYGVRIKGPAVAAQESHIGTVDGYGTAEFHTLLRIWGHDPGVTVTWYWLKDQSDPPLSWNGQLRRD
jgi:ATPase subunit of ABC transporter with duplicated ATPase domains